MIEPLIVEIVEPQWPLIVETIISATVVEVELGIPGPPGPPGPGSGDSTLDRAAGSPVSALTVVYEDGVGVVRPIDYRDADHIDAILGLTVTAAMTGGQVVKVVRAGAIDAAGLGLMPGRVWLGTDGALVQTPPIDGFDVLIGYATRSDRLYVDIDDNIQLED